MGSLPLVPPGILLVEWIGKNQCNPADLFLASLSKRALSPYPEMSTFLVTDYVGEFGH